MLFVTESDIYKVTCQYHILYHILWLTITASIREIYTKLGPQIHVAWMSKNIITECLHQHTKMQDTIIKHKKMVDEYQEHLLTPKQRQSKLQVELFTMNGI